MDHPRPWLRYIDGDDLETSSIDFHKVAVDSASGDKLGTVDGFVVDESTGRPYYVAVDAGGWFKSKLFLLPIGHVAFDAGRKRLIADVTKDRVERFPGFDRGEFEKLSEDELRRMDEQIVAACCPTQTVTQSRDRSRFDEWPHYKSPSWWQADFYRPDRADRAMHDIGGVRR